MAMPRGQRAKLALLFAAALSGCSRPVTTSELLARRDYAAARERADMRKGREWALLDTWVRARAKLTVSAGAAEAQLSDQPPLTWPLRLNARLALSSAPLTATGVYRVYVRSAGLLWGGVPHEEKEWARAAALMKLLGGGPPWSAWPGKDTALNAWSSLSLVCSASKPPKDRCETELLLMPMRPALGPDALVIDTELEWPDSTEIPDHAQVEFLVLLPPGPSLAERIQALFARGPREVQASPREIARE